MADSNSVRMSFALETSQGVPPDPLNMIGLCYTGGSFQPTTDFTDSNCINPYLMASDTVPTKITLEGTPEFEMSFREQFHYFLPAVIYSVGNVATWGGGTYEFDYTKDLTAVETAGAPPVYTFTALAADTAFNKLTTGQWIKLSGFTNEANNCFCQVTAINTTADPHVITVSVEAPLVDEVGTGIRIQGSMVRNGRDATWQFTNPKSTFCVEQSYPDLGNGTEATYFLMYGCQPSSFSLTFAPNDLVKGNIGLKGTKYDYGTATWAVATAESTVYPIMSAASSRVVVMKDGSITKVTNFGITISDLAREQVEVGNIFAAGTGRNQLKPELNVEMYWESRDAFTQVYDVKTDQVVERSYSVRCGDSDGNTFVFTFPRVVLTGVQLPGGALNEDLKLTGTGKVLPYTDPVTDQLYEIQIDRFFA